MALLFTNLIIPFLKGCQIAQHELFPMNPAACFQQSIILGVCRIVKMAFTGPSRRLSETQRPFARPSCFAERPLLPASFTRLLTLSLC